MKKRRSAAKDEDEESVDDGRAMIAQQAILFIFSAMTTASDNSMGP
jgi:hypothetical protein